CYLLIVFENHVPSFYGLPVLVEGHYRGGCRAGRYGSQKLFEQAALLSLFVLYLVELALDPDEFLDHRGEIAGHGRENLYANSIDRVQELHFSFFRGPRRKSGWAATG